MTQSLSHHLLPSCFEYQGIGELQCDHPAVTVRTTCQNIKRPKDYFCQQFCLSGPVMDRGCVDGGISTESERCYVRDYVRKLCEQKAGIIRRRNKNSTRTVGQGKINTQNIKGIHSCN
jgi:hypothetical protein